MAKLDKKWTTLVSVTITAMLSTAMMSLIFAPHFKSLRNDIQKKSTILKEEKRLLTRKPALQAEWNQKKNFFNPGVPAEEVLNVWVKELLASAQSQALALEKLEPAGIKKDAAGKKLTVFLSFQGDIRKLASFVYQLKDKDPLARIESLDIRLEEGSKIMTFELLLGKIVK